MDSIDHMVRTEREVVDLLVVASALSSGSRENLIPVLSDIHSLTDGVACQLENQAIGTVLG
jgi:hypothetical protein